MHDSFTQRSESNEIKEISKQLGQRNDISVACVASVSVGLGSKKDFRCFARAKNGSFGSRPIFRAGRTPILPLPTKTLATQANISVNIHEKKLAFDEI